LTGAAAASAAAAAAGALLSRQQAQGQHPRWGLRDVWRAPSVDERGCGLACDWANPKAQELTWRPTSPSRLSPAQAPFVYTPDSADRTARGGAEISRV
jgi:hypothetical protein